MIENKWITSTIQIFQCNFIARILQRGTYRAYLLLNFLPPNCICCFPQRQRVIDQKNYRRFFENIVGEL